MRLWKPAQLTGRTVLELCSLTLFPGLGTWRGTREERNGRRFGLSAWWEVPAGQGALRPGLSLVQTWRVSSRS